jgi:hypothetical protein
MEKKALFTAVLFVKINFFVKRNKKYPKHPAIKGATIQAVKICATPCHPQLTFSIPIDAVAAPTKPPMRECVVETGSPWRVANVRKSEDDTMVHIMTRRRTPGELS